MGSGSVHFLPVNDEVITVTDRSALQPGKVSSGLGFREP
jgi:hypothetical protein